MEKIRVSKVDTPKHAKSTTVYTFKVEDVKLWRRGQPYTGTLHVMPHHLVFSASPPSNNAASAKPQRAKEVWITYPMISHCTLRPSPTSHMQPTLRLRCRDFTFYAFEFRDDKLARDVYDSIRSLSCKLGRLDKLQAFSYKPKSPENELNGWQIYDPRREWKRLGINSKDTEKGWRISEINVEYKARMKVQEDTDVLLIPKFSTPKRILPSSSSLQRCRIACSGTQENIARVNEYPHSSTAIL